VALETWQILPRPKSLACAGLSRANSSTCKVSICDPDEIARHVSDKLVLMAQEFLASSEDGSTDHSVNNVPSDI